MRSIEAPTLQLLERISNYITALCNNNDSCDNHYSDNDEIHPRERMSNWSNAFNNGGCDDALYRRMTMINENIKNDQAILSHLFANPHRTQKLQKLSNSSQHAATKVFCGFQNARKRIAIVIVIFIFIIITIIINRICSIVLNLVAVQCAVQCTEAWSSDLQCFQTSKFSAGKYNWI